MKINPLLWREVKANEPFQVPQGSLHVMCSSAEAACYLQQAGVECLAGVGSSIKATYTAAETAIVTGPKGMRVFLLDIRPVAHEASGTVYTNMDRMPVESGSVLEVKKALRLLKLEQKNMLQEMKAAAKALPVPTKPQPELENEPDVKKEDTPSDKDDKKDDKDDKSSSEE